MHFPPKFLQKPSPLFFFMVHLLHRLYGVDAPVYVVDQTDRHTYTVITILRRPAGCDVMTMRANSMPYCPLFAKECVNLYKYLAA